MYSSLGTQQHMKVCDLMHVLDPEGWHPTLFFFLIYLILFLAALGLGCCVRAFSSCGVQGLLLVAVHRLLIAVASLVAEHGLEVCRLSSCGLRAQ